ncbi:MAG: LysR family transcriptional regulator [Rhodoferax sp.]|nr:LysR family transcriptional regulator [Rhodoferax sp.]
MELRHIRYFIAAAEEEHFGRASDRMHVTRPAVSQIIADLEQEIGTPLFERHAHRVKLTAAGRTLLPQLQAVMAQLKDAVALAKRVGQGKSGALNIGYGSLTLLHPLFRDVIKALHETYPDISLSLFEMSTTDQPKALAERKIHAGFMHFGPGRTMLRKRRGELVQGTNETVLDWIRIQAGGLGVAMANDHALAKRKSVTLADLAGENFVIVPNSSSSPGYGPLYALCKKAGFEPRVVQEVATISTQLNLISVGMGVGLAVMGRRFQYPAGLTVIPLEDVNYTTSFVFAWVKGQKDPALDRMIEIIKAAAT